MKKKFYMSYFKCGQKGYESSECQSWQIKNKWCTRCSDSLHNTGDCQRKKEDAGDAAKKTEDKPGKDNKMDAFLFTFKDQDNDKSGMSSSASLLVSGATSHNVVKLRTFESLDEN